MTEQSLALIHGIIGAILVILASWTVGFLIRHRIRENHLIRAWFELFAQMLPDDSMTGEVGIDADWIALHLCGLPLETKIKKLPSEQQQRVVMLSEDVRQVGAKLVKLGFLAYMPVSFENQGKFQKINPSPTLFKLAAKGKSAVLRIRTMKRIDR